MEVNFLPNKKKEKEPASKEVKDTGKWSEPENEPTKGRIENFLDKKPASAPIINPDVSKSRKEMLKSIKVDKENVVKQAKSPFQMKNIFDRFKPALKKGDEKKNLADYHAAIKKEKTTRLFSVKKEEAPEISNITERTQDNENDPAPVLETNLIKGEAVIFFDWKKNIIMISASTLAVLLALGLIYIGIIKWGGNHANNDSELVAENEKIKAQIENRRAELASVAAFQNKIVLANELLKNHVYWTNFFKFLEDNTLSGLHFVSFSGDTKGKYSLSAIAEDYNYITAQIKTLRANENVKNVNVGSASISSGQGGPGQINFELKLEIDPKIFYR